MHRLLLLLLAIPVRCASPYDLERAPPIRDVQVIPEVDDSFIKRIPARIGSPEQDIVIMPWACVANLPTDSYSLLTETES